MSHRSRARAPQGVIPCVGMLCGLATWRSNLFHPRCAPFWVESPCFQRKGTFPRFLCKFLWRWGSWFPLVLALFLKPDAPANAWRASPWSENFPLILRRSALAAGMQTPGRKLQSISSVVFTPAQAMLWFACLLPRKPLVRSGPCDKVFFWNIAVRPAAS